MRIRQPRGRPPKFTAEDKANALALALQGHTAGAIAQQIGASTQTICNWLIEAEKAQTNTGETDNP